ncbi:hypothetical protein [Streptomyces sp. MspMP-M5]|uniref:hypothetical protein n=1 Tax=Streptomyces sp. MspMP-M5 TaxID=1155718 RepID=UPI0003A04B18|nr:hypothetical protein [Streptomyces sp. MspMP-M5]
MAQPVGVIRKRYLKDGGSDFVWSTTAEVASPSNDERVTKPVADIHRRTKIEHNTLSDTASS